MLSRIHGLVIESDFVIDADRELSDGGQPDVRVTTGPSFAVADAVPDGRLVGVGAHLGQRLFSHVRRQDGSFLLRYHGVCELAVSADLRQVVVHSIGDGDPNGRRTVIVHGLLPFLLVRLGHTFLTASAVDIGAGVVAFAGRPRSGKSTTAALMCAAGARLVSDHVLRVDFRSDRPVTRLGTSVPTQRLPEPGAAILPSRREGLPLKAVVLADPDPDVDRPVATRLSPPAAALTLFALAQTFGWQDPALLVRLHAQAERVAASVPVLQVRLPWGPPYDLSTATAVRRVVLNAGLVPPLADPPG